MTFKVVIDAGHGMFTAGKRTPDDEREWSFNNKVALAVIDALKNYPDIQILRVDDPTGKTDVPLKTRTDKANKWQANIYVSIHHNANTSKWGSWTGTETYTYLGSNPQSERLAKAVHPKLLTAYDLRDRGIRQKDLHVLRETKMPAILVEGGFMDSTIDIKKLRSDAVLTKAGQGIAEGIVQYLGVTKKVATAGKATPTPTVTKPVTKSKLLTVKADKLFTYKSPNWNDKGITVSKGEVFTVVDDLIVDGSKMYKLKSGLYITANTSYVSVK